MKRNALFLVPLQAFALLLLAAVTTAFSPGPLVVFNVNDVADAVDAAPGDGVCATAAATCTLRAAIQEANALAGADSISVPAGVYQLTIGGSGENAAATGDLDINGSLTITGAGAGATTVDAIMLNPGDRVFHVLAGNVTIQRLEITGGRVESSGGGLLNINGVVRLQNARVEENVAHLLAAGVSARGGGLANGGGGTLTLINSDVIGNAANTQNQMVPAQGGGIYNEGRLTVRASDVNDNQALSADPTLSDGGGIYNGGLLARANVINSILDGNAVQENGGAIANHDAALLRVQDSTLNDNIADNGGGLANVEAIAVVTRSTVSNNTTSLFDAGGGLYNLDGTLNVDNSTVSGNVAATGGGIYSLEDSGIVFLGLLFVTVTDNEATGADGGGGLYASGGDVLVNLSTFSGNEASAGNGGGLNLWPAAPNFEVMQTAVHDNTASGDGGGIALVGFAGGASAITRSAIYGNTADDGGGLFLNPPGAFNMSVIKSTVSGNQATDDGGGLFLETVAGSVDSLASVTVVENDAGSSGGGIYVGSAAGAYNVYHTMMAHNTAAVGPNCDGFTLTSTGFNLLEDNSGCTFASLGTDQVGTAMFPIDPLIGSLQDNGGSTWTHALLTGSPAIDTGHATNCTYSGASDQRGEPMPVDGNNDNDVLCDIGGYEKQP